MDYLKILLIAPYKELAEQAYKTSLELHKPCRIIHAEMENGAEAAQKALDDGIEVIISRGGTASLIRQVVNIPVIEIEVTGYDILRTLLPLKDYEGGPFGIIGYPSVIQGCQTVAQMLGIDVLIYQLQAENEALASIKESRFTKTQLIIGDTVAIRYAEALQKPVRLITSGPESIMTAILQAEQLLKALELDRAKTALSTTILNAVHEGVVTIDRSEKIISFNSHAQKLLKISSDILGQSAGELFSAELLKETQSVKSVIGRLESFNGQNLVVNLHPIVDRSVHLGTVLTLQNAVQIEQAEHNIRRKLHSKGLVAKFSLDDFIGQSPSVRQLIDQAYKFAKTDSSILIQGESGTGKELLAQGIHLASQRRNGPFVAINCAALPEQLLESELFGYEEGAFTGARRGGKPGLFELAHKGTLFLDEVGELPLHMQARLLRVLQEKEVMRIGGDRIIPIDVRLVSATHKPLREAVEAHEFRADLFYRLNVLALAIPPLRKRPQDIKLLMDYFLINFSKKLGKPRLRFCEEIYYAFEGYHWPGNVRELRNSVEKLVVLSESGEISVENLGNLSFMVHSDAKGQSTRPINTAEESFVAIEGTLKDIEMKVIEKVLGLEKNNLSRAARRLGIDRSTLWRKMRSE